MRDTNGIFWRHHSGLNAFLFSTFSCLSQRDPTLFPFSYPSCLSRPFSLSLFSLLDFNLASFVKYQSFPIFTLVYPCPLARVPCPPLCACRNSSLPFRSFGSSLRFASKGMPMREWGLPCRQCVVICSNQRRDSSRSDTLPFILPLSHTDSAARLM